MDSTGVILKSKLRGSLAWLLSKAYRGQVPAELANPLCVDNNGADQIKPQIIEALADAELFGSALATIYAQPKYLTLDHHGVIHVLIQKCVFTPDPDDASITETVLRQIAPLKVSSHLVIIDAIMAASIKSSLELDKVIKAAARLGAQVAESPENLEQSALIWVNAGLQALKSKGGRLISLQTLEELSDLGDGSALAALISLYCPQQINAATIHFGEMTKSMSGPIGNWQMICSFCADHLPENIWHLHIEDFICMHPSIKINVLSFIADLWSHLEVKPVSCVEKEAVGLIKPAIISPFGYQPLPKPTEMRHKSMQHSSWTAAPEPKRTISPTVHAR